MRVVLRLSWILCEADEDAREAETQMTSTIKDHVEEDATDFGKLGRGDAKS